MNPLNRLLQGFQKKREERESLETTIEEIVDIADPSIRRAGHYQRLLRQPVQEASSYCAEIIGRIPGPVRLSKQSYSSEPEIRALFAKAEDVEVLLKNSPDVEVLRRSGFRGDAIGLLTMDKEEKTVFGHEKHGELIQRDVVQHTVNFSGHRIVSPSPDLDQARAGMVHRGLEVLATVAMENITNLRAEISDLRQKRDYLAGFIQILNGRSNLHSRFATPDPEMLEELEKAKTSKAKVEAELEKRLEDLSYPKDALRHLSDVMLKPSSSLTMGSITLRLNWMNVRVDEKSEEGSNAITLAEISLAERLHRYGIFVVLHVE